MLELAATTLGGATRGAPLSSLMIRNACPRPLPAVTSFSPLGLELIAPILSPCRVTIRAATAANSRPSWYLVKRRVPKCMLLAPSRITHAVISRSSRYWRTCSTPPLRAVTFQSMRRTSSPGWYSRTSARSRLGP